MLSRRFLLSSFCLALTFGGLLPCEAEPDTRAKAQVFSRELADGARIEFVWDSREKVPFSIDKDDGHIILHFDEPVSLRWNASLKALHPYVSHVETRDGGDTVILTLNQAADPEYYLNTSPRESDIDTNGLDLVEDKETDDKSPTPTMGNSEKVSAPVQKKTEQARAPRKKIRLAKAKQKAKSVAQNDDAAALAKLAPAAGASEPAAIVTPVPASAAAATSGNGTLPAGAAPSTAATSAVSPVTPAPAAAVANAPSAMKTNIPNAAPVSSVAAMPSSPAPVSATAPTTMSPAVTHARDIAAPETATLPLPMKSDDPTAVFIWQKRLWIVTESVTPPAKDELRRAGASFVSDVEQIPDPHATILALPLEQDVSASIEKTTDDRIRIVLQHETGQLAHQLTPAIAVSDSKEATLTIPSGKASDVLSFQDPQTGSVLTVIPLTEPGTGVATGRSFVDFNLLVSAQGIAVEKLADGLTVTANNATVTIGKPGGLLISPETAQQMQEAESEAAFAHLPPTLFPYARWKLDNEQDFVPTETKLFGDMANGTEQAAQKDRLKLLGLYLSEGQFPESAGMANEILRNGLKFYQNNKVSALRGAAEFFMSRTDDALRDFSVAELQNDKEAALWRSLCMELLGEETPQPFRFTANYDRYISHYPPSFIQKLALIAADRSIMRKDFDEANSMFGLLKRDAYDEPIKKYIYFLQAKILAETHDEAEAVKIWEDLAKNPDDRLVSSRSEYSLINLQLRGEKISHDEAIKRLERLRIGWRGDSLELDVLSRLSNLYLQDKQYDKALSTMRDIVLYYPQMPQAVTTARKMEDTFVTLYNKGGAEEMPPLESLALFYEFRDLVPLGAQGDQMIRNLADRLVSIDLLDRAALLLDHQIRNRLQGEDRSRIAAHLAQIYLLNHQPEKALDTLKTTGYGDLPPDLQLIRQRLTAQALAQQGQTAKAIGVISSDNSPEGTMLRLSIYWDNKDWPNVVSIAEDVLGNRNDPTAPLNTQESNVLLKLATAYVYQHDAGQLQYLRDYFSPLMKNNPDRASFQFITSESGTVNYDNLAGLDQDINAVKSFIANSQDKPGKNGLSKAAN